MHVHIRDAAPGNVGHARGGAGRGEEATASLQGGPAHMHDIVYTSIYSNSIQGGLARMHDIMYMYMQAHMW